MPCSFAELFYYNSQGNENYDMEHVVAFRKIILFCSETFQIQLGLSVEVIKDMHSFTHL